MIVWSCLLARWQNGYVADCKSVYAGSIPARASKLGHLAKAGA